MDDEEEEDDDDASMSSGSSSLEKPSVRSLRQALEEPRMPVRLEVSSTRVWDLNTHRWHVSSTLLPALIQHVRFSFGSFGSESAVETRPSIP